MRADTPLSQKFKLGERTSASTLAELTTTKTNRQRPLTNMKKTATPFLDNLWFLIFLAGVFSLAYLILHHFGRI
jgi:hypothetical protein